MAIDASKCPHGYRDSQLCPACVPIVWGGPAETDSAEPLAVTLARMEAKLDILLQNQDHREELANLRYMETRYLENIAKSRELIIRLTECLEDAHHITGCALNRSLSNACDCGVAEALAQAHKEIENGL